MSRVEIENTERRRILSEKDMPIGSLGTLMFSLKHYGFLGSAGRYLIMLSDFIDFIDRSKTKEDKGFRKDLIRRFNLIHEKIPCLCSPLQFVIMAEYLFNLDIDGPIVECGCYYGGSTAKLSLLAKKTNRKLFVCDSFEGLPIPKLEGEDKLITLSYKKSVDEKLSLGDYKVNIDQCTKNVREYGCIEVCEFIKGFFEETLPKLKIEPAFVCIDVDYVSSARTCIQYLWPRLKHGGFFFTHEAGYPFYLGGVMDPKWWHENLEQCPPLVIGAGSGLSSSAESVAFFQKIK